MFVNCKIEIRYLKKSLGLKLYRRHQVKFRLCVLTKPQFLLNFVYMLLTKLPTPFLQKGQQVVSSAADYIPQDRFTIITLFIITGTLIIGILVPHSMLILFSNLALNFCSLVDMNMGTLAARPTHWTTKDHTALHVSLACFYNLGVILRGYSRGCFLRYYYLFNLRKGNVFRYRLRQELSSAMQQLFRNQYYLLSALIPGTCQVGRAV